MISRNKSNRIVALISERGGGDAPPVVTLAAELHARGYDVCVLCDYKTLNTVRSAGLEPIVIPDELEQGLHVDPRWLMQLRDRGEQLNAATANPLTAWAEICAPAIEPLVRQRRPAVLISSLFCTSLADLLAKRIGIPWCFINPSFYFGDHGAQLWEDDFAGLGAGWFRYILLPHCDRADLTLHATDSAFDPPPCDLPDHHRYIGPLLWEPVADEPPSYLQEPGAPWALISLSTVPMGGEMAIARAALQALADKPVRTLLTLAQDYPRDELGPIPDNAVVCDFVPHGLVLGKADLVVSHAGHGIVMKCLYYGVPMVLVPWARDQFGVARRAKALGVADVVPRDDCSAERVADAVNRVFSDSSFARRASDVSKRLLTENPADRACRFIEDLLRQ